MCAETAALNADDSSLLRRPSRCNRGKHEARRAFDGPVEGPLTRSDLSLNFTLSALLTANFTCSRYLPSPARVPRHRPPLPLCYSPFTPSQRPRAATLWLNRLNSRTLFHPSHSLSLPHTARSAEPPLPLPLIIHLARHTHTQFHIHIHAYSQIRARVTTAKTSRRWFLFLLLYIPHPLLERLVPSSPRLSHLPVFLFRSSPIPLRLSSSRCTT